LFKDMEQTKKMINMRIKVDVWFEGRDKNLQKCIRENVDDLFCQLPVRIVWLYLKLFYYMMMNSSGVSQLENLGFGGEDLVDGPEDIIAKSKILHNLPVYSIYEPNLSPNSEQSVP
jgi:cell division septal protein FtsQ